MNLSEAERGWIPIQRDRSRQPLLDAGLVLTAVEIDSSLAFDGHQWVLWVPPEQAGAAVAELDSYRYENRPMAPRPTPGAPLDSGLLGVLGYLLVIWAPPWFEAMGAFGWQWRDIGVMDAARVIDGEWWRTVTALTLHADIGHIIGNSLFGALFGLMAGRHLGSGFAWLLILLGGVIGNALNAWIQVEMFRSLGASTATFAALALVGAFTWRRGYFKGLGWRRSLAPVFGGIAMLVYTGLGGEDTNTDVVAHLTGFAAGFLLGWLAAGFDVRRFGRGFQWLAGAAAVGLVVFAWSLAGGQP